MNNTIQTNQSYQKFKEILKVRCIINRLLRTGSVLLHQQSATTSDGFKFRSGTHISRISNSVTHLQSYTNTAIARNSVLGADITAPSAKCQQRHIERCYRRCGHINRQYCRIKQQVFKHFIMFPSVVLVVHNALLMVHNVSQVFHDILRVVHDV